MKTTEEIVKDIKERFGFIPPFFEPAFNDPRVLQNLWDQTLFSYVENPIPNVFKEKLAALLARYCTVPYCLMCHSSALRPMGISAVEVLELLEMPLLGFEELAEKTKCLQTEPVNTWPETGSHLEECILYCCIAIFLNQDTEKCHEKLRFLLKDYYYNNLVIFLAYNKTALSWAEAHPELSFEKDKRVIDNLASSLKEEPRLADFFANYQGKVKEQGDRRTYWLTQEAKKLLDSEKKYRLEAEAANKNLTSFFKQSPMPMAILTGPDYYFALANDPYEKLISRKAQGKTVQETFSKEEVEIFIPLLDDVYRTGTPYIGKELPFNSNQDNGDIKSFFLDIGFHAFRDENGEIKGILASVQDVTEQTNSRLAIEESARALTNERQNYVHLFEGSSGFFAILSGREFEYEYSNPTNNTLVGQNPTGKYLKDVIPDAEASGLVALFTRVYQTGKPEYIFEFPVTFDGEVKYFDGTYVAKRDSEGNINGVLTWGMEVTGQVRSRIKIEETVKELEMERDLRENFVAALTHDLRTPLTAAKLSAQILSKKSDSPEMKRLSDRIVSSMDRSDMMIRDLLDAGKIKAGEKIEIKTQDCVLNDIVDETIDELKSVHGERFHIKAPQRITGHWDCNAIRRVVENLASNAIKYGSEESPVTIELDQKVSTAEITVHNLGNPIPHAEQEVIFNKYQRSSSTSTSQKGWGLGLTLVRGFVEAHHGKAAVRSSTEQGTTFLITIPLDPRTQRGSLKK